MRFLIAVSTIGLNDTFANNEAYSCDTHTRIGMEYGSGDADPEGEPLVLVVVVVPVEFPEQGFKLAGVLADEEGRDPVEEDRVEVNHVHGVGDGEPLGTVGRADADEEVAPVAEQLHRGDLHRIGAARHEDRRLDPEQTRGVCD